MQCTPLHGINQSKYEELCTFSCVKLSLWSLSQYLECMDCCWIIFLDIYTVWCLTRIYCVDWLENEAFLFNQMYIEKNIIQVPLQPPYCLILLLFFQFYQKFNAIRVVYINEVYHFFDWLGGLQFSLYQC